MNFPHVTIDSRISIFSIGTLVVCIATMLIGFGYSRREFEIFRDHLHDDTIHIHRATHKAMAKDIEEMKDGIIRLDEKIDAWILKQSE